MNIKTAFSQFQSNSTLFKRNLPGAVEVHRANPYQLHNKAYRDQLVSQNIFNKALQLYNDITASQAHIEKVTANVRSYVSNIKTKSLTDILRGTVQGDSGTITESTRGKTTDIKN